jgi:signal transduction histidine kinase
MAFAPTTHWLRSRLPLRLKLTIWMILISFVLQGGLGSVVLFSQRGSVEASLESRAKSRADTVSEGVLKREFHVTDEDLNRIAGDILRFTAGDRFVVALFRPSGEAIASNIRPAPDARDLHLDRAKLGGGPVIVRNQVPGAMESSRSWRLVLKPLRAPDGESYVLLVGTGDASYDQMLSLSARIVALSVLVGVGAAALGSWMIAGLATAPIHELRRLAGALSPESIEQEVELSPSSLSSQELAALRHELEEARFRLRESLHAQDRFISSVSHELKTPIAVLLTEAQTLNARALPEEPRRFVQSVTEEMRRLGRMVESFLTLTKVRGGMKIVNPERRNLNDVVMEAIQSCSRMARQYGVTLAPELAESEPPPTVSGDAELLRVMTDNLIHNAIRFSREGQPVSVSVIPGQTECEIRVRDTGPGVPEEMKDKLFERFVQAPDEACRGRGHGLGLSIAQGIAELHGGRIAVRNVPDGGCEFYVMFPLVELVEADGRLNATVRESSA